MEIQVGKGARRVLTVTLFVLAGGMSVLLCIPSYWFLHWPLPVSVLPWVIAVPIACAYVPRWLRSVSVRCVAGRLTVKRGVIWHREQRTVLTALQAFEVWEPPLHRLFDCCTVVLRVAGGCLWLPLLDRAEAQCMIAKLDRTEGSA